MVSDSVGQFKPGTTIKGDVVRVDGDNYFVRQGDGTVVRMHVDNSTTTTSNMPAKPGDSVEAKVDAAGHAISFLTDQPVSH
jgi:ribosomal protein S1